MSDLGDQLLNVGLVGVLIAGLGGGGLMFAWLIRARSSRYRSANRAVVCECGYSRDGLSVGARCPECGQDPIPRLSQSGVVQYVVLLLAAACEFVLGVVLLRAFLENFSAALHFAPFMVLPGLAVQGVALALAKDVLSTARWTALLSTIAVVLLAMIAAMTADIVIWHPDPQSGVALFAAGFVLGPAAVGLGLLAVAGGPAFRQVIRVRRELRGRRATSRGGEKSRHASNNRGTLGP